MTIEFKSLREEVCEANLALSRNNLITLTWGNVSGVDRERGVMLIKPSGVSYEELTPTKLVIVDLKTGEAIDSELKPSSDTPTHLELYRYSTDIGGVAHTHSVNATSFAQAMHEIPCFGTTHADYFYGSVPVTRKMTDEEIKNDYELNTGKVIVESCEAREGSPCSIPAVLVAQHGPFTWGETASKALEASIVLEEVAKMALATYALNPNQSAIDQVLLDKHYLRKHGENSYYGQN